MLSLLGPGLDPWSRQRVWMGQAVSPFETMGRRKMRGDDEGGGRCVVMMRADRGWLRFLVQGTLVRIWPFKPASFWNSAGEVSSGLKHYFNEGWVNGLPE